MINKLLDAVEYIILCFVPRLKLKGCVQHQCKMSWKMWLILLESTCHLELLVIATSGSNFTPVLILRGGLMSVY